MRILKLSPYCEPEQVASTHLTNDFYEALFNEDFIVENYVPIPTRGVSKEVRDTYNKIRYEEQYNGKLKIHRFWMFREGKNPIIRAFRYLCVNIIQYKKGIKAKKIDVLYAGSTPPTQGVLCGLVKKKIKVPLIYVLQDIFPDSLENAGLTRKGSLIWKVGRLMENYTYSSADKIIVISNGFKENIVKKGVSPQKIEVVSNWIDLKDVKPIERANNKLISEFNIDPNKYIVLYAGNFGAAQGAEIIIEVARKLQYREDIEFVIFGGGAYFENVKENSKDLKNVIVHGLLPLDRVSEVYSLGDIALITCKKGTGNAGLPSKVWSIMACNTPIVASFDVNSDLSRVIKRAGAGKCIEPENVDELVKAILDMKNEHKKIDLRAYVKENASKEICVQKYIDIIKSVANEREIT